MDKVYKVSDLFYTHWNQLPVQRMADGYMAFNHLQTVKPDSVDYGKYLIFTLRALRKNWRLVDKINVPQAVDIFNELKPNLEKPWYNFPVQRVSLRLEFIHAPKEKMGNRSFDHLVYADSCFTKVLAAKTDQEQKHNLAKLMAVLYIRSGELTYNDRVTDVKAMYLEKHAHDFQLWLTFYTFAHIKKYIVDNCVHLFEKPKADSLTANRAITDSMPTWTEIKFSLAESGVFGDFDKVGQTDVYKVINYLESRAKKQQEAAQKK
jgi:hypothetical protein